MRQSSEPADTTTLALQSGNERAALSPARRAIVGSINNAKKFLPESDPRFPDY